MNKTVNIFHLEKKNTFQGISGYHYKDHNKV